MAIPPTSSTPPLSPISPTSPNATPIELLPSPVHVAASNPPPSDSPALDGTPSYESSLTPDSSLSPIPTHIRQFYPTSSQPPGSQPPGSADRVSPPSLPNRLFQLTSSPISPNFPFPSPTLSSPSPLTPISPPFQPSPPVPPSILSSAQHSLTSNTPNTPQATTIRNLTSPFYQAGLSLTICEAIFRVFFR